MNIITLLASTAASVATPFRTLYRIAVWQPLFRLYRLGPSPHHSLGCWRNASDASVCEILTGVPVAFWNAHSSQCSERIEHEFAINMVVVETFLYFYALALVYRHVPTLLNGAIDFFRRHRRRRE